MSIEKSLKNAMLTGAGLVSWQNNAPTRYNDRQKQFFGSETSTFIDINARYASDFVEARMQGLNPDAPFEWQTRMIRIADIVKPTAAIQRNFDDYKTILVADRDVEYLMPGSKVETMGSTWLVFNPLNISGSDGSSVIRRCNAVWNHLDYYGNVVSEPLVVENQRANANDSDSQNSQLISKGYFNVMCQYNDDTRQIDTNTRLILGTAAYRVTGFSDFEQEFTGDYGSVRMLKFTVRFEDVNNAIDDMENHVAGGKNFSWDIIVDGPASISVGTVAEFKARSVRNDRPVEATEDAPISYEWESSDESVATVDYYGNVTAVSDGTAIITATLAQNEAHRAAFPVEVTEEQDGVKFTSTVPRTLGIYENVTIEAALFENGEEQPEAVTWAFTGAANGSFAAEVGDDGKSATVTCYGYSDAPLTVTVSYFAYSVSAEIKLEGI